VDDRLRAEIALLKGAFPELEVRPDLWCRFEQYSLPDGIWNRRSVELGFQIPPNLLGQPPYGFWVRPGLRLASGAMPTNYSEPVQIALGSDFGQFSWAHEGEWRPAPDPDRVREGSNMVNFAHSISQRLREAS
jgi:hypothetical protein